MKTITIIGAGAAGLMVAATILEGSDSKNIHIRLFDKNTTPGKKVILSGGGRCNLTTGIEDKKILLSKYTRGSDFIKKAMGKFPPKKVREWFESHGVPLKCEADNRVFPVSDDGRDIVWVFESIFRTYRKHISLHYGEWVMNVTAREKDWFEVKTEKWIYTSDVLIITTGGNAYSHTGSSGDGYTFAKNLWHTITPLGPSLSSFLTKESWTHELSGLAFEKARITLSLDREKSSLEGALLLTHFGISGPLAFMTSSKLAWEKISAKDTKTILFSPVSELHFSDWESFLKEQFQNHPKKFLTSILSEKLSRRFAEKFTETYFSHLEATFAGSIAKTDREMIAKLLGNGIPITLLERRPGDEFVTAWGVSTDEVNPETMESKIHKNLYFAGEVLNVDGYTGGFSLQMCWASGYASGKR